jgi:hypothetical protein
MVPHGGMQVGFGAWYGRSGAQGRIRSAERTEVHLIETIVLNLLSALKMRTWAQERKFLCQCDNSHQAQASTI